MSSCISSSLSRGLTGESEFIRGFAELLTVSTKQTEDSAKILRVMREALAEGIFSEQISRKGLLAQKIRKLHEFLEESEGLDRINEIVLAVLKKEVMEMVEVKVDYLKKASLTLCNQILNKKSSEENTTFIDRVEGFFSAALREGVSYREALIFALKKSMVGSLLTVTVDECIQEKIEQDPGLQEFRCVITGDILFEDVVYLRVDSNHRPYERYKEASIRKWIEEHHTDPITREDRSLSDIKHDFVAKELMRNKLQKIYAPGLIPEAKPGSSVFLGLDVLCSKSFMLALGAAHSVLEEEVSKLIIQHKDLSNPLCNPQVFIQELEGLAKDIISRFVSLVEGLSFEGEEVDVLCFPLLEEFLKATEKKLVKGGDVEEVRAEFTTNIGLFITFFHEIEPSILVRVLSERGIIGEAIARGTSFVEIREVLEKIVNAIQEEDEIRASFPGCLIGASEWIRYIGEVEKSLLPEGMLSVLNGPCPINPSKRVGETHLLVLVPSKVNGHPLTIESFRSLVESGGHVHELSSAYSVFFEGVNQVSQPLERSQYVLMIKDTLPGTRGMRYSRQRETVAALGRRCGVSYQIPDVLSAVVVIFMNYIVSREILFNRKFSHCMGFSQIKENFILCEEEYYSYPVIVGNFSSNGLLVVLSLTRKVDYRVGVAALRKFIFERHF